MRVKKRPSVSAVAAHQRCKGSCVIPISPSWTSSQSPVTAFTLCPFPPLLRPLTFEVLPMYTVRALCCASFWLNWRRREKHLRPMDNVASKIILIRRKYIRKRDIDIVIAAVCHLNVPAAGQIQLYFEAQLLPFASRRLRYKTLDAQTPCSSWTCRTLASEAHQGTGCGSDLDHG